MVTRDLAARGLALAVRALPATHRDWGLAMQAELAAVEEAPERRAYAWGCARAVLTRPATLLRLGIVGAVAATALAMTFRMPSAGVRAETFVLLGVLAVLAVTDRPPSGVRRAGYAAATLCLLFLLAPSSGGGHNDPSGWWLACAAIALYFAAVRFATPRAAWVGVAALGVWWVPMLLSAGARAHPGYALAIVAAAVLAGGLLGRTPSVALGAGAATCLLIFLAAVGTYAVAPSLVPDVAPTAEANRIESTDPYVAELLLGGLLGAALIAAGLGEPGRRARA
jgi:hypothetical protein